MLLLLMYYLCRMVFSQLKDKIEITTGEGTMSRMISWKVYFVLWILAFGCQNPSESVQMEIHKLEGATMGTTWHLTYEGPDDNPLHISQIDAVLELINQAASTYVPTSIISRLNKGETVVVEDENPEQIAFFRYNVDICNRVWEWSRGYFDPTVMELVNYWGFGYEGHRPVEEVDSARVDSLLQFVGYEKVADGFTTDEWKLPEGFQIDFSAVAKGAACDWVGKFLEEQGISNYLIEIGGEMYVEGPGREGEGWIVGVSKPRKNAPAEELIEYLAIRDKGLATSGNYRNYYESNGRMITHTINPKTGYSEERRILSATIVADDCGTADALATAIMAMGVEEGKEVIGQIPEIEAFLIYNSEADTMVIFETEGMKSLKYNTTKL